MLKGIDYSYQQPNFAEVKAKGYSFVFSYFSKNQGKDWTKGEFESALNNGLQVGAVYELSAKRALDGFSAGVADANDARVQAHEVGYTGAIYFAVDFRPTPDELKAVVAYFQGVSMVLATCGVYGSYETLEDVKSSVAYGWQVSTWSPKVNGKHLISSFAALVQDANQSSGIPGTDYDYSIKNDMGLHGQVIPVPDPGPAPLPPYEVTMNTTYPGLKVGITASGKDAGKGWARIDHAHGADPGFVEIEISGNRPDQDGGYPNFGGGCCYSSHYDGQYTVITFVGFTPGQTIPFRAKLEW